MCRLHGAGCYMLFVLYMVHIHGRVLYIVCTCYILFVHGTVLCIVCTRVCALYCLYTGMQERIFTGRNLQNPMCFGKP